MTNKDKKLYRRLVGLMINIIAYDYITRNVKTGKEIRKLQKHFKLSEEDLRSIWFNKRFRIKSKKYKEMPRAIHRDNKDYYNTSSTCYHSNRNKIRYPSKKRNKKTWSNFYKLFPGLAKSENWDGQKSDRYNPKNIQ